MRYSVPTEEAVKYLVGKVRGYSRNGVWYDQEDGEPYTIDGKIVLENILNEMREVLDVEIGDEDTEVEVDVASIWDFLSSSGYRDMGYSEEEAEQDIEQDILGILGLIKHEYEIKVDPYAFAKENEPEEDVIEEELEEEFEEKEIF